MKMEAERKIDILCRNPNNVFKLVKLLKKHGKDEEGKRCIRESDERLCFNENDHRKIWKDHE